MLVVQAIEAGPHYLGLGSSTTERKSNIKIIDLMLDSFTCSPRIAGSCAISISLTVRGFFIAGRTALSLNVMTPPNKAGCDAQ